MFGRRIVPPVSCGRVESKPIRGLFMFALLYLRERIVATKENLRQTPERLAFLVMSPLFTLTCKCFSCVCCFYCFNVLLHSSFSESDVLTIVA